ncbi:MAG: DUF4013 domain-containing protein [Acidobacteriia bacterium]|nr:DUF4013 domain-containing protein [Terriglobia bacterium]
MSDLGRSFVYPFRHRAWLGRVLVGAALDVAPLVLLLPSLARLLRHGRVITGPASALLPLAVVLGLAARFLVFGYLARAAREVLNGTSAGLPPWDRMADDLVEGLKLWLVVLALCLPAIAVTAGLTLLVTALTSPTFAWLPLILAGPPAALLTLAYVPAGLLAAVSDGEMAAAFDFDRVIHTVGRAFGPYALAFLVAFGAEIFAQLGLIACCIGILVTRFIAHCVTVHAFATAFREGVLAATPLSAPEQSPSA